MSSRNPIQHPLGNKSTMTRLLALEEELVTGGFGLATIQSAVEIYTVG